MRFPLIKSVLPLLLAITLSSAAPAQTVLPGSVDFAGSMVFNSYSGLNGRHVAYSVNGGYNLWSNLAVIGEYGYQTLGSTLANKESIELIGAGARYYFKQSGRIAPYAVGAAGFADFNNNAVGTGNTVSGHAGYFGAGGGASIYFGDNWGLRPELRYQRELFELSNAFNSVQGSVSLFYQFGGREASKKK
jgi:hypothetical protein